MDYSVFDIETDGLIEKATVIHCVSVNQYKNGVGRSFTMTNYDQIREFFLNEAILVGHNIIRFDIPVAEKLLGIKITSRLIDTLGISWYLYPLELKHGLEEWGVVFGVPKPVITDWTNQSLQDYIHRCQEDIKINTLLFNLEIAYLNKLYAGKDINRIMGYLSYKLTCAREQEEVKWKLDVERCKANLTKLEADKEVKMRLLSAAMPQSIIFKKALKPKELFKKDGSYSVVGQRWINLLNSRRLPLDHSEPVVVETKRVPGNAGSPGQIKAWLFDLGWIPDEFKYVREEKEPGVITSRAVPQVSTVDDSSIICESVKALFIKEPALKHLESLGVLSHRIGILEGFLETRNEDDMLKAEIAGFTNTLRFKHKKPLVNLPTIPKPYWEEIRSCLIAPSDDHVLCGSDMSGLEDNTKRHYMYFYDPEYVKEMMGGDFDAHLDIAMLAGILTREESDQHKLYDKTKGKEGKSFKAVRGKAKKVNFSGIYGAGPPKIAITAGIPLSEAKTLHKTYWNRNWSVKQIAKDCIVKKIDGQMWLWNPVSQFWYSLRYEKDRFSTLNQGTGVYCFDTWVSNVRAKGVKVCGQFHDEIVAPLLKGKEDQLSAILNEAIQEANDVLKLNIKLGISIDFGRAYSDIH